MRAVSRCTSSATCLPALRTNSCNRSGFEIGVACEPDDEPDVDGGKTCFKRIRTVRCQRSRAEDQPRDTSTQISRTGGWLIWDAKSTVVELTAQGGAQGVFHLTQPARAMQDHGHGATAYQLPVMFLLQVLRRRFTVYSGKKQGW